MQNIEKIASQDRIVSKDIDETLSDGKGETVNAKRMKNE